MRRREQPRPERAAGPAPRWITALGAALQHAAQTTGKKDLRDLYPVVQRDRARWCAENGCWRPGKTCREVFGTVPTSCQEAGGPKEA